MMTVPEYVRLDALDDPLGVSLRKQVRKTVKGVKEAPKRLAKQVKSAKKSATRFGKTAKKEFVQMAPVLAVAAQGLNFLVPGLGVAVGSALVAGAKALQVKEAQKAAKAEDKKAQEEAAKQEAVAKKATDDAAVTAYVQGETFFAQNYGMTKEKFQALSTDDKMRFLNVVVYDQNSDHFQQLGISREMFAELALDEQAVAIASLNDPSLRPSSPWPLYLGIGAGVLAVGVIAWAILARN